LGVAFREAFENFIFELNLLDLN